MKSLFSGIPQHLRHNFLFFYLDIAVWGLYTGSTLVFLTVYAARAGASSEQIGWLSAGPAIVALLAAIPTGVLARRYALKTSVVFSAILSRAAMLLYVFIPVLVAPEVRIDALLAVTVLVALAAAPLNICFGPFFMAAIPAEWRGTVVGVRNALMSIISFPVTLLCGQLLVGMGFPGGYQVVFFIGFVGAMLTVPILLRIKIPHMFADAPPIVEVPAQAQVSPLRRLFPRHDPAGRHYIVVVFMLFALNAAGFMAAPLVPDWVVNHLRLNDAVISLASALSSVLVFGVSLFMARLTRRMGNRKPMTIGAALLCLHMLTLASAQDAVLYLVAAVIGGVASGVLMAAQFNYHLENVPKSDQTAWIGWNSMLGNVAALLGSVVGPLIARQVGIPATLAGLGLLRLGIGVLIWWRG